MPDNLETTASSVIESEPPDPALHSMKQTSTIDLIIDQRHEAWSPFLSALEVALDRLANQTVDRIRPTHKDYEISLVLECDEAIQQLNARYRYKDKPTNVLSFPQIEFFSDIAAMPEPVLLGDIVMSFETIEREAQEQNKPIDQHVRHLFVHGLLHLLGYDHQTQTEAKEMEDLEIEILKAYGDPSPYEQDM